MPPKENRLARTRRRAYRRTRPNRKTWSADCVTLSPRQSCKLTGFGLTLTYKMLAKRRMPGIQVGNRWYIPRAALLSWLEDVARGNVSSSAA
jgi:excisionase family DNA binding protein